jgi:hypothetical protein
MSEAATKRPRRAKGTAHYSTQIDGARGNYGWPAAFDVIDGYVGITQRCDNGEIERVLLSPAQYRALVEFVEHGKHRPPGEGR